MRLYISSLLVGLIIVGAVQEKPDKEEIKQQAVREAIEKRSLDEQLKDAPVEWMVADLCGRKHKGHCQESHICPYIPCVKGLKAELKIKTTRNGKVTEHKPVTEVIKETYLRFFVVGHYKLGQTMVMAFDLGVGKHQASLTLAYKGDKKTFEKTFETVSVLRRRSSK